MPPVPYVELSARSAFSFLEAASTPERLVDEAARLEVPALGLLDVDGVYGAPRFHKAARAAGVRPLVGAALTLADGSRLGLLAESRAGYRALCRLLTRVKARAPKGQARATLGDLDGAVAGLLCLTGGADGPLTPDLLAGRRAAARGTLERLVRSFGRDRVYVELQRHGTRESELVTRRAVALAREARLPIVATGGVRHATPGERPILDVLTAIRLRAPLDALGRRLSPNAEQRLRTPAEMARRFADLPEAVAATGELAARCALHAQGSRLSLPRLPGPRRPAPDRLPPRARRGRRARALPPRVGARAPAARPRAPAHREARPRRLLPDRLGHRRYCPRARDPRPGPGLGGQQRGLLRLGITAVDPVGMELLFERFLSEERGEWPDIDLDLPSGERREAVIQYVYGRYGGPARR